MNTMWPEIFVILRAIMESGMVRVGGRNPDRLYARGGLVPAWATRTSETPSGA